MDRFALEKMAPELVDSTTSEYISMPLIGFYLFAWFGFSVEARNSYQEAFTSLLRVFSIEPKPAQSGSFKKPASRWPTILTNLTPRRKSNDILPTTTGVTPFAWPPPSDSEGPLPSRPEETHRRSEDSGEAIETGPEESGHTPRAVTRRLSFHKPPLPSSAAANTCAPPMVPTSDEPRWLSCHKPSLPPFAFENTSIPPAVATLDVVRPLSFHKPPLPPFASAALPAIATLDIPRRLSFHKPRLPPIAPANASALSSVITLEITPQTDLSSLDPNESQLPETTLDPLAAPHGKPGSSPAPPITPSSLPPTYRT